MKDSQKILHILVGIVLGVLLFWVTSEYIMEDEMDDDHEHAVAEHMHDKKDSHDGHDHHHDEMIMVDAAAAPTVSVTAHSDGIDSVSLELMTTNFTFAPHNANQEHVAGEGHAHLYVDDVKVARVYGNWFHLDNLSKGTHEIRVGLFSNDHKAYSVNDEAVEATVEVVIH